MENKKKRGKIRYVLKSKATERYDKALPHFKGEIANLNIKIKREEKEVGAIEERLQKQTLKLRGTVKERDQLIQILRDLDLIKGSRTENGTDMNPSEIVSKNNPDIEIYLSEESLNKVEDDERAREKRRTEIEKRMEKRR